MVDSEPAVSKRMDYIAGFLVLEEIRIHLKKLIILLEAVLQLLKCLLEEGLLVRRRKSDATHKLLE